MCGVFSINKSNADSYHGRIQNKSKDADSDNQVTNHSRSNERLTGIYLRCTHVLRNLVFFYYFFFLDKDTSGAFRHLFKSKTAHILSQCWLSLNVTIKRNNYCAALVSPGTSYFHTRLFFFFVKSKKKGGEGIGGGAESAVPKLSGNFTLLGILQDLR